MLFPVSAFVAAGFEHSVANMYLIRLGLPRILWGLVPVTLGNMIGGGLLVGGVYWFVYSRPRRRP